MLASFSEAPLPGTGRQDTPCKCCRCRHRHLESERTRKPPDKDGLRYTACPKCGATSYHDMTDAGKEKADMTTATPDTRTEDIATLKGQINVLAHWCAEVVIYLSQVRDDENFQGAMSDEEYRSLGDLTECGKRLATDVLYPGVAEAEALNLPAHRSPYRWMHWQIPGTLPDSDTTVMVSLNPEHHTEPVWLGYHDGLNWMDIDGTVLVDVLGWAHLPEGVQR